MSIEDSWRLLGYPESEIERLKRDRRMVKGAMFHLRDGIYFAGDDTGRVTIQVRESARIDAPVIREVTVPENEWASIVASVSARGETSDSYLEARTVHTRQP